MRWVRYELDGRSAVGIVEGDRIAEAERMSFDAPPRRTGRMVPLVDATLLPPVVPPTFYAVGINYLQHVRNAMAKGMATQVRSSPMSAIAPTMH